MQHRTPKEKSVHEQTLVSGINNISGRKRATYKIQETKKRIMVETGYQKIDVDKNTKHKLARPPCSIIPTKKRNSGIQHIVIHAPRFHTNSRNVHRKVPVHEESLSRERFREEIGVLQVRRDMHDLKLPPCYALPNEVVPDVDVLGVRSGSRVVR